MNSIIYFILLNIISVGAGYALLSWSLKWSDNVCLPLRTGAAYFVGMAFNIAAIRTLSNLFDKPELLISIQLLMSIGLCFIFHKQLTSFLREIISSKLAIYTIVGGIILMPLMLLYWLPDNNSIDPFSFVGSLHSVRYAWIANYITECGHIPVIGQNTGQSILSFMGSSAAKQPYLFLFLWLSSSIFFLSVFVYGIFKLYESRSRLILLAVLIFMMGNTALSVTHVLVIDSGSPFALNGYTDSLFGVFSVLMLLLFHAKIQDINVNIYSVFIVAALICVSNFFTAPQNMLYLFGLIPLLIFINIFNGSGLKVPIFWSAVFIFSALISIPQGGMLTPKILQADIDIPGLMTVHGRSLGVHVLPGIPFHFGSSDEGWSSGQMSFLKEGYSYVANWRNNLFKIVWVSEQIVFTSLRVLFFPIVGILSLFLISRSNQDHAVLKHKDIALPSFRLIYILGIYTFIIGFIISFSLSLNGYKWELSRFLIPGITIGMLAISLSVLRLFNKNSNSGHFWLIALIVIMTIGPLMSMLSTEVKNINYSIQNNTLKGKFQTFLGQGPVIDKSYCRK